MHDHLTYQQRAALMRNAAITLTGLAVGGVTILGLAGPASAHTAGLQCSSTVGYYTATNTNTDLDAVFTFSNGATYTVTTAGAQIPVNSSTTYAVTWPGFDQAAKPVPMGCGLAIVTTTTTTTVATEIPPTPTPLVPIPPVVSSVAISNPIWTTTPAPPTIPATLPPCETQVTFEDGSIGCPYPDGPVDSTPRAALPATGAGQNILIATALGLVFILVALACKWVTRKGDQ